MSDKEHYQYRYLMSVKTKRLLNIMAAFYGVKQHEMLDIVISGFYEKAFKNELMKEEQ